MATEKEIKTWKFHIDQGLRDLFNLVRKVNNETKYGVFFVVLPEGYISATIYNDKEWIHASPDKPPLIKDSLYKTKPDLSWDEIEYQKSRLWITRMETQLYNCLQNRIKPTVTPEVAS